MVRGSTAPRRGNDSGGGPRPPILLLVPAPRHGTRSDGTAACTDCARALGATSGHRCLRPVRRRPYRPVRLVGHPWQRGSLVVAVAVAIVAVACAAATVIASLTRPLAFPSARPPSCQYVFPLTYPIARLPMRPPAPPAALARPPARRWVSPRAHPRLRRPSHPLGFCVCVCVLARACARVRAITLVFRCLRAYVRGCVRTCACARR